MASHPPRTVPAMSAWDQFPPYIREKIAAAEDELDQLHPGWRTFTPFDKVPYEAKARIKWLLKRRSLLTHTENGVPAPLDWDVLVVPDGKDPKKCYAHPVIPAGEAREVTRNPPSPVAAMPPKETA